jgi:hypothetical protein
MTDEAAQPAEARRAGRARPHLGSSGRIKRAADFLNLDSDTRVRLL